jgi:hypothetical protein
MRAQIIPRAPLNLIFEPGLYMLLRFQKESCARKLRDQKRSLFNAFEIFDHTSSYSGGITSGQSNAIRKEHRRDWRAGTAARSAKSCEIPGDGGAGVESPGTFL